VIRTLLLITVLVAVAIFVTRHYSFLPPEEVAGAKPKGYVGPLWAPGSLVFDADTRQVKVWNGYEAVGAGE
jgi:hypothetical protein